MSPLLLIFCCLGVLGGVVFWAERRLCVLEIAVAELLRRGRVPMETLKDVVEELARKQAKEKETRAKFDEESG